jgi:hypothetical protein
LKLDKRARKDDSNSVRFEDAAGSAREHTLKEDKDKLQRLIVECR